MVAPQLPTARPSVLVPAGHDVPVMGLLAVILAIAAVPVLVYLSVRTDELAQVRVVDGVIVIRPRGLNRLWAFRTELRVPVSSVSAVRTDVPRRGVPSGFRMPGTYVPGLIQAGTYRRKGEKSFWLAGRSRTVTVIECRDAKFDRVVLQLRHGAVDELLHVAGPDR